jgi:hypothetical protein
MLFIVIRLFYALPGKMQKWEEKLEAWGPFLVHRSLLYMSVYSHSPKKWQLCVVMLLRKVSFILHCRVSGICVTNMSGFWIWLSNLLDLYATGYNSSQITIWHAVIFFRLDTPRELFWFPTELNWTELNCQFKSQSYIATDGQSVSKSWRRAPDGAYDQIFITLWQLRSSFCGAPSLTSGRVCLLYMLLTLAR